MKIYFIPIVIIINLLYSTCIASPILPQFIALDQPWSITASAGNGNYQISAIEKNVTFGRLALANDLFLAGDFALGFELGLQTGNELIINFNKNLDLLSWYPLSTSISPNVDLLLTSKSDPLWNSALFAQLKGGLSFRHWKMNVFNLSQISQLSPEVQAGFGYPITSLANINLLYLGIYGSKPYFVADIRGDRVFNIPTLHAVLIGLSVNL